MKPCRKDAGDNYPSLSSVLVSCIQQGAIGQESPVAAGVDISLLGIKQGRE
jgi:hypothetical protein